MNYGLYLSASGVLTNSYRQDVYANNLANAGTTGFKPDVPTLRHRAPESVESRDLFAGHQLLDKLGGGSLVGNQRINFQRGAFDKTNRNHDVALEDPHTFLAVRGVDADNNPVVQLTRDGALGRNADGFLVNMANGFPVLNPQDQPIRIEDTAPFSIGKRGEILQNEEQIGQLQITGVTNVENLEKRGKNVFGFKGDVDGRRPAPNATIQPGYLESSGVDPIRTLLDLVAATKAITANGNMIRYHDSLMDKAVNVLGRTS